MRADGKTVPEIVSATGLSKASVYRALEMGINLAVGQKPGLTAG